MSEQPTPRTETGILAAAMDILARDIQSADGVANAAIAEAGQRLREQDAELTSVRSQLKEWEQTGNAIMMAAVGREAPLSDSDVIGELTSLRYQLVEAQKDGERSRWRKYEDEPFTEVDLPVWGYYPNGRHRVRLIDFMGNQMTHWMPTTDSLPQPPDAARTASPSAR